MSYTWLMQNRGQGELFGLLKVHPKRAFLSFPYGLGNSHPPSFKVIPPTPQGLPWQPNG